MDIGVKIFFVIYNLVFWGMSVYVFISLIRDRKICKENNT